MSVDSQKGRGTLKEVKEHGPYHYDPFEVLEQLRTAVRSNDEVFLGKVLESARALKEAFEWQDELDDAEQVLYEMTCLD